MIFTEKHRNKFKLLGKYYGYPDCCVDSFILSLQKPKSQYQINVHQGLGFIPCDSCATKILNGETTIDQLIQNRIYKSPFPNNAQRIGHSKLRAIIAVNDLITKLKKSKN